MGTVTLRVRRWRAAGVPGVIASNPPPDHIHAHAAITLHSSLRPSAVAYPTPRAGIPARSAGDNTTPRVKIPARSVVAHVTRRAGFSPRLVGATATLRVGL